jgi:hypothetical protein
MSNAARSVFVFGIYLVLLGLVLVAAPNVLLGAFRFPPATEVWIRVVGMLVLCLAYYYTQAARRELRDYFRLTVHARTFVFVCLGAFAALRLAAPQIALFGTVDLLGAVWTATALRTASD